MLRRTTIELDPALVERAKRALGTETARATVEEALRRVANAVEAEEEDRAHRQRRYFERLGAKADLDVLAQENMWR